MRYNYQNPGNLKYKYGKKILHSNTNQKKGANRCTNIKQEVDFKAKVLLEIKWDISIDESIYQENRNILKVYTSNNFASKYIKLKLTKLK